MSGAKLKIVSANSGAPTQRGPEREQLAVAIAYRDTKQTAEDECRRLLLTAETSLTVAKTARRQAAAVAENARAKYAERALQVARGSSPADEAPLTPSVARERLAVAEDVLEVAQAVRDGLTADLAILINATQYAASQAADAAKQVLATLPSVATLTAELADLQQQLVVKSQAHQFLVNSRAMSSEGSVASLATSFLFLGHPPVGHPGQPWHTLIHATDGAAPYRAALAELQQDADAATSL